MGFEPGRNKVGKERGRAVGRAVWRWGGYGGMVDDGGLALCLFSSASSPWSLILDLAALKGFPTTPGLMLVEPAALAKGKLRGIGSSTYMRSLRHRTPLRAVFGSLGARAGLYVWPM